MGRDLRILAEQGKDWIPEAHPSPGSPHRFRAQGGNRSSPAPGSGRSRTRKDWAWLLSACWASPAFSRALGFRRQQRSHGGAEREGGGKAGRRVGGEKGREGREGKMDGTD